MGAPHLYFTLHTHRTCPAAFKVAHVLSLLKLTYKAIYYDPEKESREAKLLWFAKLNPNGRSPVLIDHAQNDHVVWESTAILIYLVQMYDTENTLWPKSIFEQSQVNQWLMLQASGQGPTIGQAFWFGYWHHEVLPTAYKRYVNETKRILTVLEKWLSGRKWLIGGKMSIADVSYLSWYEEAYLVDIDLGVDFPLVNRWLDTMKQIPEIIEGSKGREMIKPKKLWERPEFKEGQAS